MKKLLIFILLSVFVCNSVGAEEILLKQNEKHELRLSPVKKVTKDKMVITKQEELQELVAIQQESEIKDLEMLWQATVDNNQLIKFALQKLNAPEGQKRLHSSIAAKTLSAAVYGASYLPMFMGGDALTQSASFATGRLVNNFLNKASTPTQDIMTDTELIELAGTVETLQDTIISTYYNYKGALNKLRDTRARIVLYNKNYSNALKSGDELEILISSSSYQKMLLEEFYDEQEAKKYCIELQRLAGEKTVEKLSLAQYAYKNTMINPEKVKNENK